jgi:DNA-binding PadR family transcriptional regulator
MATTSPTRWGLVPDGRRIDLGNLYRLLRALESDGVVESEWRADLPGPTKRTYQLTGVREQLLDQWAVACRRRGEVESHTGVTGRFPNDRSIPSISSRWWGRA